MCGIVGYLGTSRNAKYVIDKLKNLEYRGYDSSGIADLTDGKLTIKKAVGKIANLDNVVGDNMQVTCAIAHTRWATHGVPSETNAHPHSSVNSEWTIVHNGIIENYNELKAGLKNKDKLQSATDTVVVAELLEERKVVDINGFIDTCNLLNGSFAFVAINKANPNKLFLARNKSPLYCSFNNGEVLVASDPICFSGVTEYYYGLNNGEFAECSTSGIVFYDRNKNILHKEETKLDEIFEDAGKGEYDHFMLKEIMEESVALNRIVKSYTDNNVFNKFDSSFYEKYKKVEFIGCGTAYHAGLMGARFIEKIARIPSCATIASEFIYMDPIVSKDTLYVFVSQSGETADTLRAMELVKERGCDSVAITNVLYSSLSKAVDYVFPVCAGPEIAVASTKAYVCQIAVLYCFATHLKNLKTCKNKDYLSEIKALSKVILNIDKTTIEKIADELKSQHDCIYIGKDLDYITACEACLKLKEIAYISASSYPSGELKHGFLALIEEGSFIFVLANHKSINSKTYNSANEAISRGAKAVLIGNNTGTENFKPAYTINLPDLDELLLPMASIVPLQYLAYLVSIKKGINPDTPRNLAKSVTVE